MRTNRLAAPLLVTLTLATAANAGSVYLNGTNIDGVTSQKFERATVRIDEKGNVFIDAQGYAVRAVEGGPTSKPAATPHAQEASDAPGRVSRRYWLVTEQTVPGMTEFDIDLYVNSKWVRKIRNSDEQIIQEITKHLVPGRNTVLLTAQKVAVGPRKSLSPEHVFRVIIGEGNVGGDNVMIDNPIVRFERKASEANNVSQEFTVVAR